MARLLHEQARAQLGIDWGTPERPNCRGFTPEELARIDFKQLDLGEAFEDMLKQYQSTDTGVLQQRALTSMKERLTQIGADLQKKSPPKDGRVQEGRDVL